MSSRAGGGKPVSTDRRGTDPAVVIEQLNNMTTPQLARLLTDAILSPGRVSEHFRFSRDTGPLTTVSFYLDQLGDRGFLRVGEALESVLQQGRAGEPDLASARRLVEGALSLAGMCKGALGFGVIHSVALAEELSDELRASALETIASMEEEGEVVPEGFWESLPWLESSRYSAAVLYGLARHDWEAAYQRLLTFRRRPKRAEQFEVVLEEIAHGMMAPSSRGGALAYDRPAPAWVRAGLGRYSVTVGEESTDAARKVELLLVTGSPSVEDLVSEYEATADRAKRAFEESIREILETRHAQWRPFRLHSPTYSERLVGLAEAFPSPSCVAVLVARIDEFLQLEHPRPGWKPTILFMVRTLGSYKALIAACRMSSESGMHDLLQRYLALHSRLVGRQSFAEVAFANVATICRESEIGEFAIQALRSRALTMAELAGVVERKSGSGAWSEVVASMVNLICDAPHAHHMILRDVLSYCEAHPELVAPQMPEKLRVMAAIAKGWFQVVDFPAFHVRGE